MQLCIRLCRCRYIDTGVSRRCAYVYTCILFQYMHLIRYYLLRHQLIDPEISEVLGVGDGYN